MLNVMNVDGWMTALAGMACGLLSDYDVFCPVIDGVTLSVAYPSLNPNVVENVLLMISLVAIFL